ncbi:MAG: glucoamylase family protein [Gemmatimonadaceae bacterium]
MLFLSACVGVTAPIVVAGPTPADASLLDDVERRTFRWFWDLTPPTTGLTPDRAPTQSFSSIAAIGFALTAYPVGVERGYVSRGAAATRTLATLRFLYTLPEGSASSGIAGYHGFFYHFLDPVTGLRYRSVELSTIDTALLLAGVIACQEYFDGTSSDEGAIRAYADSLDRRTDWAWAVARPPVVAMGWHPEKGFIPSDWRGYNEAMLLYILALGSPTHPVPPAAWTEWTRSYSWAAEESEPHVVFGPLFGHQYSHVWVDFQGIRDEYMRAQGIDYFENSRRATLSQRTYAIRNPDAWRGYGERLWGVTASDGPTDTTLTIDGRSRRFWSYAGRGVANRVNDGTIAPTGAVSSLPFAPEVVLPTIAALRADWGDDLYNQYGFIDALNPTLALVPDIRLKHGRMVPGKAWFDVDQLGIDQGPILLMIENYRSGLVWRLMRKSPHIVRGLRRAGFTGGWLDAAPPT